MPPANKLQKSHREWAVILIKFNGELTKRTMKKILLLIAFLAVVTSCDKSTDATIDPQSVELKVSQTQQLTTNGDAVSDWTSSDTFVATVTSEGMVTALHVGQATIWATVYGKKQSSAIRVVPTYNSFSEPLIDWGLSRAAIKEREKRTFDQETESIVLYKEPRTLGVVYLFENDRMTASGVVLPLSFDPKELVGFLNERYSLKGQSGDLYIWQSKDNSVMVAVGVESVGIIVAYVPISKSATAGAARLIQENRSVIEPLNRYSDQELTDIKAALREATCVD